MLLFFGGPAWGVWWLRGRIWLSVMPWEVGGGDSSVPAGEPLGEWKTLIQHLGMMRLLVSCPRVLGGSVYCTVGNWQWDNFRIQGGWEAGRGS